jgi:putative SOS response-associated peptidase YedK
MCGRFVSTTDPAVLGKRIGAVDETGHRVGGPNYNVAPTSTIAAVVARRDQPDDTRVGATCTRRILPMRWGLLPPWVKADSGGRPLAKSLLINARAETLISSPAFRSAARSQRCLIPMDGYYEWMPSPEPGAKTPFYLFRRDDSPILVAGLWSAWRPDGAAAPLLSATIVTTAAVGELERIHDRMPLMLADHEWDRWLDPDQPAPAELLGSPPDISAVAIREVSRLVNRVANNSADLLEPADRGNRPVGLF